MQLLNLVLFSVLVVATGWALVTGYQNRKRKKLNDLVAGELDFIIRSVTQSIEKTKKYAAKAETLGLPPDINSPEMLSTLVTVLVNKLGTVNLSLDDFSNVGHDEYVSIYVNGDTEEIILSLNHAIAEASPYMTSFGDPDDNTFH